MSNEKNSFYTRLSQSNVMSDGMLKEISYGDYALMMVAKDRPLESKAIYMNENNNELK
ncbi:hypothetical protein [Caldisalinibacter kiritimatiensis]|uniref:Uncharacterized protein n=1 Tax=Caldisalinibacter kiritimatiensis TaxID=1304284 RepID=R1CTP7_9FIRM|nr:hypothetical protein [Caldisalinibacter kiritimatiensis]EOD00059.1 hypothetical protein L21TH_1899 [Caldisalinibacter kiritimatiensis]